MKYQNENLDSSVQKYPGPELQICSFQRPDGSFIEYVCFQGTKDVSAENEDGPVPYIRSQNEDGPVPYIRSQNEDGPVPYMRSQNENNG